MRIELILPTLKGGGMETIVTELALQLSNNGHAVGVTCIEDTGVLEPRLAAAKISVSLVPLPGLLPNLHPKAMVEHLRALAPDIVHSHSGTWLKSSLPARRAGVKGIVHTVHGLHEPERWRNLIFNHAGSRFTDVVAPVSASLKEYLLKRVRIPRAKIQTVLNGVDTRRFNPEVPAAGLRRSLGLPADAFLLGIVARFSPVKDHATLIQAFHLVQERHPRAHLLLIGSGSLGPQLEALSLSLGVQDHTHFLGTLTDTAPAYRDLDTFVLSSLSEGTSMSILEALSSGVPVVATAVGGNPALLGNGAHGLLIPPQNPERLARAVCGLIEDEELRACFRTAGRAHVEAHLSIDIMVRQYESIYRRTVDQHR